MQTGGVFLFQIVFVFTSVARLRFALPRFGPALCQGGYRLRGTFVPCFWICLFLVMGVLCLARRLRRARAGSLSGAGHPQHPVDSVAIAGEWLR